MKNNIILWVASLILTFLIGYAISVFSPDYPITGTFGVDGKKVSYRFEKIHFGKDSADVLIRSDVNDLNGKVYWQPEDDSIWHSEDLLSSDLALFAKISSLKPNHDLKYYITLTHKDKKYFLPDNQKVVMKFFAKIPDAVSSLKFLLFYLGLLLIIRVGLEYFNKNEKIKKFEVFIAILFLILTALVNPLYLSYKFGFINTSIPSITKLFPVKELVITSLWIITTIITFNIKKYRIFPLISAVLTIIILFIFN